MSVWRMRLQRTKSAIISWHDSNGPRQANLVLIAYASSEGSGEPAHPRSLARTFAARSYKQWIKRNLQTESQIPGPSEWLCMRSWNLSWRNARRHKFAWRGPNEKGAPSKASSIKQHKQKAKKTAISQEIPSYKHTFLQKFNTLLRLLMYPAVLTTAMMILSFRTDMPGLLEEQSDQGLHYLQFRRHVLVCIFYDRATFFEILG